MNYNGKVAIVTGGASGIGLGLVKQCIQEGMKVMIADINAQALDKVSKELAESGAEVASMKMDVTKDEDWADVVKKTLDLFGQIDVLFSNAGVSFHKSFATLRSEEWKWVFDVNFWSNVKALNTILPVMNSQESGGHIVITSSTASMTTPPTMISYSCTKHALVGLAEGLSQELALAGQSNVKISLLLPALVSTNIKHNEAARPNEVENLESNYSELDKKIFDAFNENHKKGANKESGFISIEEAGERIFDQMKRGFFYIYTSRNFTKHLAFERATRYLNDDVPVDAGIASRYYGRKSKIEKEYSK